MAPPLPLGRLLAFSTVGLVGLGVMSFAMARGRKPEPEPTTPAPPPAEVAPAPPPAPAPALFAGERPVVLGRLPPGLASLSAQGCNGCHYAAHDTWAGSAHAHAWRSPSFQAALASAGETTACVTCHLPLAAQHAELAVGYVDGDLARPKLQPNPSFDVTLRAEGVTCAACHVREGKVLASRPVDDAPHPVVVSAELREPSLCANCHQLTWPGADKPFYDTYGEWERSAWAKAGVTCQDCHMAPTTGVAVPGSDGTLPSHGFDADARRALSVLVDLPTPTLTRGAAVTLKLTVQNTGAGHDFPTGTPFLPALVDVLLLDAAGKELAPAWTTSFAREVDKAPPWKTLSDTRLRAGGQWKGEHAFTPSAKGAVGMGSVQVRLRRGEEKTVLAEIPVELR